MLSPSLLSSVLRYPKSLSTFLVSSPPAPVLPLPSMFAGYQILSDCGTACPLPHPQLTSKLDQPERVEVLPWRNESHWQLGPALCQFLGPTLGSASDNGSDRVGLNPEQSTRKLLQDLVPESQGGPLGGKGGWVGSWDLVEGQKV